MLGPRRLFILAALCAPAFGALGCLAPTLPLPPPARPDISPPDASGISTVRGRVPGGTTAMVENLANGQVAGEVTDDSGDFEILIPAEVDDRLSIYYVESLKRSQSIVVLVPEADPGAGAGGAGGQAGE